VVSAIHSSSMVSSFYIPISQEADQKGCEIKRLGITGFQKSVIPLLPI